MKVGQIIKAKLGTAVNSRNEVGVCYEAYREGNRAGWGIIFEDGGYDGFSPEEVRKFLVVSDHIDQTLKNYEFTSVLRLRDDYDRGLFSNAFELGTLWKNGFDIAE